MLPAADLPREGRRVVSLTCVDFVLIPFLPCNAIDLMLKLEIIGGGGGARAEGHPQKLIN